MEETNRLFAVFALCVAVTGLSSANAVEADEISPALSVFLDRSYYTNETDAVVVFRIGSPSDVPDGRRIVVQDGDGNELASLAEPPALTRLSVPIGGLAPGRYDWKVAVLDADGDVLSSQAATLIKREPKPGCEWKIDRIHRVVLRNGTPFFPYGIIMPGQEDDFRAAAELGLNTVHTWSSRRPVEQASQYVEYAARYGLTTVIHVSEACQPFRPDTAAMELSDAVLKKIEQAAALSSPKKVNVGLMLDSALRDVPLEAKERLFRQFFNANRIRLTEYMHRSMDSPHLLGYFLFDEPMQLSPVYGRPLYQLMRDTDGYHPGFVVYSSGIPDGDEYTDWMDVLGTDPYWTPGDSGVRGTINFVSKITALTDRRAAAQRQVTWIVPMAEYWSGIRKRAILPKEQFCQTYLALIHGAKAIIYFRWPLLAEESRETLRTLAPQMNILGPIAVTPDVPQRIVYDPGQFDPETDQFADVQVSLRRNPAGGYVLLAANSRYYPVDVTYRVSLLGDSGTVRRLFAADEYPVKGGTFADRLEFMDTRAYLLDGEGISSGPVEIRVRMTLHPEQTDPVYGTPGDPDTGRPGKRNILRNPGFEEASLRDWPDYYQFEREADLSLDTQTPYEGKLCLRVESGPSPVRVYAACSPHLQEPAQYTLSAYMRADREGAKVRFVGFGYRVPAPTFGHTEFSLTTQWQRYSETGTLPTGLPPWHSVGVLIPDKQQTAVYVDAIQFEQGDRTTPYEP
jgi:hypothetical protein